MTKSERVLAKALKEYTAVNLVSYTSVNGKDYYKCKTLEGKPLNLITKTLFNKLRDIRNVVSGKMGEFYQLDTAKLYDLYTRWDQRRLARIEKRSNSKKSKKAA